MRDAGVAPSHIGLAAALARPGEPLRTIGLDEPIETLGVLRRNKVPLLSLNEAAQSSGFLELPEVSEALAADRALLGRLRSEYDRVLRAFDEQGIRGVFIKSVGLPPSFPVSYTHLTLPTN